MIGIETHSGSLLKLKDRKGAWKPEVNMNDGFWSNCDNFRARDIIMEIKARASSLGNFKPRGLQLLEWTSTLSSMTGWRIMGGEVHRS